METEEAIQELQKDSLQKLPDKDLLFLIESYVTKRNDYENIASLIRGDEDIIGKMIDSDRVFNKVMNCTERILEISPYFLFSLLLRRALREKRKDTKFIEKTIELLNSTKPVIPWNKKRIMNLLEDTQVSNYIANMLAQFTKSSRLFKIREDEKVSYQYIVDMITNSLRTDNVGKFYIYCHIGNYTLFLTGMIPEYIEYRFEYGRRSVDEHYYVDFGKTYYGLASEHTNARKNRLSATLSQLSEGFEVVAQVLCFMNRQYLYPVVKNA
ncbi:MAG: hypothetical protein SCARUB_02977 [Candidatus Scalindua rubra]|uniref:Uncharacterized protein n=1 Tax=Candidatus Scalindua rubra TaxID=1872076 RepID=A0A1E3X8D7_9BACT|nr:MAG: hypothetical protein SCARUB_02977 [Candidatus Scalindua rubra]